jgi:hypothetical protein
MRCDAFARSFVLVPSALVLSAAPAALAAAGPAVEGVLLGHLVSDSVGLAIHALVCRLGRVRRRVGLG